MTLEQAIPAPGPLSLDALRAAVRAGRVDPPFSEPRLRFCAALSELLLRAGRAQPEVVALAYWMRRSELARLAEAFARLGSARVVLAARGTVLHVPPANVDTMFVYSWLLSFLVGNRDVIRLPSRTTPQAELLVAAFVEVLARPEFAELRGTTTAVRYGHDDQVTAALSALADLRVLWGGDETVTALRALPLPPHARELVFPDRFSFAAVGARAYLDLAPAARGALAERFFSDSYWFDQRGCSSPRAVVWVGGEDERRAAGAAFFDALAGEVVARGFVLELGAALERRTYAARAVLDRPVRAVRQHGGAVQVLEVDRLADARGPHCGGGTFYELRVDDLQDLVEQVGRRDQTLASACLDPGPLRALVAALRGRGLDRLVPIGQALAFSRHWDGHDLLQEFSRFVHIVE